MLLVSTTPLLLSMEFSGVTIATAAIPKKADHPKIWYKNIEAMMISTGAPKVIHDCMSR